MISNDVTTKSSANPRIFDDAFIHRIRDDPTAAVIEICERALQFTQQESEIWDESDLDGMIEAYALLIEMAAGGLIRIDVFAPDLNGPFRDDVDKLIKFMRALKAAHVPELNERRLNSLRNSFRASLDSGFLYEFTQGDLDRIQVLINELRKLIAESTVFEADHQRRLLARLERLQREIHKKVSDLDHLWGLIGDAGVVAGKFGKDMKPIVDRVREIVDIVWRTQSHAEELPGGTRPPLIEDKSDE